MQPDKKQQNEELQQEPQKRGKPLEDPALSSRPGAFDLQRKVGNRAFGEIMGMGATQQRPTADGQKSMPDTVQQTLGSPGEPLDSSARKTMEPRFGRDFGDVRVHSDALAAQSASELNAEAYTVGNHIVFGQGKFSPQSPAGSHLLAHELAHTIQQSSGSASADGGDHQHEQAADRVADGMMAGKNDLAAGLASSPHSVMRQAINTNAPRANLPLNASMQATAYVFEADANWGITGTALDTVNFVPIVREQQAAFFPPIQLHVDFGHRAILEIVVSVNGTARQAYYWRCDATSNPITRLDPLGNVPLGTGGDRDLVLSGLQGNQNVTPSPYIQVTAPVAAPTTSTTHVPSVTQPSIQGGYTTGAGPSGSGTEGFSIGLQRVPESTQTQRSPAAPQIGVTLTADIVLRNAPAAPPAPQAPTFQDMSYLVRFANNSSTITSPEINNLLVWAHGLDGRVRDAIRTGQLRVHITGRASMRGGDRMHNFTLSQQRVDAIRVALQGAASKTGGGRTQGGVLGNEALNLDSNADGDFHNPVPQDIDQDRVVEIFISGTDAVAAVQRTSTPGAGTANPGAH